MKHLNSSIKNHATCYSLLATIFLCTLCINLKAQESRANANPDYNFQQGRLLFDQKQYAVSSQYFTEYIEQQNRALNIGFCAWCEVLFSNVCYS